MTFSRTETVSRRRTSGAGKVFTSGSRRTRQASVVGLRDGVRAKRHPAVARGPVPAASFSAVPRPSFETVLETKLHIPPVRKDWVKR